MGDKLTRRKIQALETKKRIFDVAVELMEQKGFDNITIEQISTKANLSVGAFYHHFSSKTDLLLEIYKKGDEFFKEKVADRLAGGSAGERILSYFDLFARFYMSVGIDHIKAIFKTQSNIFLNRKRFMVAVLFDIIKQGQEKNEITGQLSDREIADFLLSTARGLAYTWCLHEGRYPFKEAMRRYMAFAVRSLEV